MNDMTNIKRSNFGKRKVTYRKKGRPELVLVSSTVSVPQSFEVSYRHLQYRQLVRSPAGFILIPSFNDVACRSIY